MSKLASYVHIGGQVYGPDSKVPADVAAQITNPKAWEGGKVPSTSKSADSDDAGYSKLKVEDLKAEIEQRNEGREDDAKVSTEGVKADLVAALEADDAAQSE